ncbi:aarF domain-containing kinase [Fistulifera solaris]|uniref:AarF domain-containing kinase n=1 Tax=Fistulifera solaris TaxID=1519565 RepID=A0A1Z5J967_FISSO|nr:aarF domain-containing kinase [Fistulifera solaris]|eukprot:GAX10544.1 aarF domain-containing kinase [Fistulifera solaris]
MFASQISSKLKRRTGWFLLAGSGSAVLATSDEPNVKAARRALRLGQTALLMVYDYQSSKYFGERDSNRQPIMQRVEECRARLAKAQAIYSNNSHPQLSFAERVQAKRHEKEAMLQVAQELAQLQEELGPDPVHTRAAHRILSLCHTNRGVYIKVGQHLASLDYLIPPEYTTVLSALYDDNPRTSPEHVAQIVKEELGQSPEEAFDFFDYTPMASASLAQVHVAYKNGRKLAIKIQHADLKETAMGDIRALVQVSRWAEEWFEGFTWGWIAREVEPLLPQELDFSNEGRNAKCAAENFKRVGLRDVIVPAIVWEQTTSRVLTMHFEEGCKATDTEAIAKQGIDKKKVANLLSSAFASQIFESRCVHCDPHPANVLLRAKNSRGDPELVLLDHGLYRELDAEFVLIYARLWKALLLADIPGIQAACAQMGLEDMYTMFAALVTARPFDEVIERSKNRWGKPRDKLNKRVDKTVMAGYAQRFLRQIMDLLARIPREMLLLLKTNDCLRHIDNALGSPANTLLVTGRYAAATVYGHESGWWNRVLAWLDYMHILLRIHLYHLTS